MLTNPLILSPLLAMVIAQISKVVIVGLIDHRWAPKRAAETGGMPSSHSAAMAALCTSSLLYYGVASPFFAISLVFGIIVVYDATGIRRAAGRHAEILNDLLAEFSHLFDEKSRPAALKTLLGHSYPQVLAGLGLGTAIAFIVKRFLAV
ncbi:MAG: hypothetical protein B0D92_00210 [Spirochaeta sp. LUC14_002_19_P3]|nr:MAG: hypothetical protein B0D92_00210 [Spirochaeta sp. LUC14_002_19_P3]